MIKKDKILLGVTIILVVSLMGFGAYSILVLYPLEQAESMLESQAIATAIRDNPTDCNEVNQKLQGLFLEDFDGVELIKEAWIEKKNELGCQTSSFGNTLVFDP